MLQQAVGLRYGGNWVGQCLAKSTRGGITGPDSPSEPTASHHELNTAARPIQAHLLASRCPGRGTVDWE